MTTLDKIRALDPVTDEDLSTATSNRDKVWKDVLSRTQAPVADTSSAGARSSARQRWSRGRRWVPVLVAASLVGGIALTVVERSGNSHPEALAFAYRGDDLKITVIDLQADTKRFNRELKQQGLNFKLELVPASPSVVGQETSGGYSDGSNARHVKVGAAPAGCRIGVDSPCHIEISVARGFRGEGFLRIGRPLRPGEKVSASGELNGRGEALEGVEYKDLQVGRALELLRQRGVSVHRFSVDYSEDRKSVPADFYVIQGTLLADGEAILWVSKKPE